MTARPSSRWHPKTLLLVYTHVPRVVFVHGPVQSISAIQYPSPPSSEFMHSRRQKRRPHTAPQPPPLSVFVRISPLCRRSLFVLATPRYNNAAQPPSMCCCVQVLTCFVCVQLTRLRVLPRQSPRAPRPPQRRSALESSSICQRPSSSIAAQSTHASTAQAPTSLTVTKSSSTHSPPSPP